MVNSFAKILPNNKMNIKKTIRITLIWWIKHNYRQTQLETTIKVIKINRLIWWIGMDRINFSIKETMEWSPINQIEVKQIFNKLWDLINKGLMTLVATETN